MPPHELDAPQATARLPGLDIEIVHRRSPAGDAEQLSINLTAAPSFDAFARYLESANPFAFWAEFARLAWAPWLGAAAWALPWSAAAGLPRPASHEAGRNETRESE